MSHPAHDFDGRAAAWDDPAKAERARRVARAMLDAAPPPAGATLFEYGCGTGLLGLELEPHYAGLTLADASEGMLGVLREKLATRALTAKVRALRLDLEVEAAPEERFDTVATLLTLHHVGQLDRVLSAFHALLRPGGALLVCDLDREDGSFHGPGAVAHDGFERSELERRLRAAGFPRIGWSTAGEIRKPGADGVPRAYPLFLAVAERPRDPVVAPPATR